MTDNGTEFKNKLWTEVFRRLNIEQKVTPIYSPQCNVRIKGFHKFLKATIGKQLQKQLEWYDLVWKAMATYNFFPTELSQVALFFLLFGREAAVKHTLLATENLKYLGSEEGILDVELTKELFHVVALDLDKARKARGNSKPRKANSTPETLKPGDNVLVRDLTSKAFQPKYKDFCIVKIIDKNQVEVKDNHGHTTKVHRKDVKKVQMIDKISDLYNEEQDSNVRSCRKILPIHKTPDLQWKLTENTEVDKMRYTPQVPKSQVSF